MSKKLSAEQKAKMQEGRKKAREKALEGAIDQTTNERKQKAESFVVGYGFEKDSISVMPIFKSEVSTFKGKIYRTVSQAKEAFNAQRKK